MIIADTLFLQNALLKKDKIFAMHRLNIQLSHKNVCEFKLSWWPVLSLSIVDSNEANYCPSTGNNPKNAIFALATLSMPAASVVVMVSCRALNHSNNGDSNLHFK